jgi:hypothetical protein
LRLVDLAQAIPGILVAVILTGYSLATVLVPRWRAWERLAAAPGLAAGLIGVLGLATHLVHIPFEPQTVLPLIGGLAVAAFLRRRRSRPAADSTGPPWWLPVPALIAGAVGAAVFVIALHGQVLPPDWDSAAHGGLANSIAQTHDVLPLTPVPLEGTLFARSRPGFEAMTAVVSWVGGPPPAQAMAPVVTAVLVLLPLGLSMLAFEATGSLALAVMAPLFAIGLAFPSDQAILGRFPQVVDSTLVVPLLVAGTRLLRGLRTVDNALLIAAAVAAIWVVHGLEVVTALVVGGALLAATAVACLRRSAVPTILRAAVAVGAAASGAVLVTVLTRLPHGPPPAHPEPSAVVIDQAHLSVHPHEVLQLFAQTDLVSPAAVGLFGLGVAAVLIRRRMLWVLVAEVVLLLAMVDNLYLHRLASLWRTLYPWGDVDRLLGVQYWLVPLILAAGVVALAELIRALAQPRRRQIGAWIAIVAGALLVLVLRARISRAWSSVFTSPPVNLYPLGAFDRLAPLSRWRTVLAVTAAAVGVAWIAASRAPGLPAALRSRLGAVAGGLDATAVVLAAVAVVSLAVGARADLSVYDSAVTNRALVTPADLTVLNAMSAALPRGAQILTDGNDDAGMWMAAVTDLVPLVPNGFEGGPLGTPLVVALANACTDPAAAAQAVRHADAVFVGAHRLPAAQHPWNLDCIARLPGLRLIAAQPGDGTEAAAFAVTR